MLLADKKFPIVLLAFEFLFLVLFFFLSDYDEEADAIAYKNNHVFTQDGQRIDSKENSIGQWYPAFQDMHVMIFIGFGFSFVFLKKYGYSSIGLNFLIAAFTIQWALLCRGFFMIKHFHRIYVNIQSLIAADYGACTVLISMGAVLGRVSPLQLIIMAFIEVIVFTANFFVGFWMIKATDVGGSMYFHTFGAIFGLAVSRILYSKDIEDSTNERSRYQSDVLSILGTIFLWVYWPSFNSAFTMPGDDQHRAVINTYLALASCCVMVFVMSSMFNSDSKFDMYHIQNATIAGGVAIGGCANLQVQPWGAVTIGILAGIISVVGLRYIQPFMRKRLKIHDTCGVFHVHGLPGIVGGVCAASAAGVAGLGSYGYSLYQIFPARAPHFNTTAFNQAFAVFPAFRPGDDRGAMTQGLYQSLALTVTLAFAIIGGAIAGYIMKIPIWSKPQGKQLFDDEPWWETPEDFDSLEKPDMSITRLMNDTHLDLDDEAKV